MAALTRRRYPERPDRWHVYYDDGPGGQIAVRPGVPVDGYQWAQKKIARNLQCYEQIKFEGRRQVGDDQTH